MLNAGMLLENGLPRSFILLVVKVVFLVYFFYQRIVNTTAKKYKGEEREHVNMVWHIDIQKY